MTDRCVAPHYKVTIRAEGGTGPFDMEFELWTNTNLRDSNFWVMFGGVEQDLDQFTEEQLSRMGQYVEDWRAPGGR